MLCAQSHQARIATLYLPVFGLLIENAHRIDVKDISPFPINAAGSVSKYFLYETLKLSLQLMIHKYSAQLCDLSI